MCVAALAAIVHSISNLENLTNAVFCQMRASLHQRHNLLELRKVSLLLGREKREPFEERDHVLDDRVDIRHFVIPDAIRPAAKSSTT